MIAGLGTDIVETARLAAALERNGKHFLDRVFTAAEQRESGNRTSYFAGRWAAKEAFSKALGTGMCADCAFGEIEVLSDERGKPFIRLLAATAETARRLGVGRIHVSISHERELATAFVVLEDGGPGPEPEARGKTAPSAGEETVP